MEVTAEYLLRLLQPPKPPGCAKPRRPVVVAEDGACLAYSLATLLWPILGFYFLPTTLLWYSAVQHWLGGQWSFWPIV